MLILLSPAKSLDYESPLLVSKATQPRLKEHSIKLNEKLKTYSKKELSKLMNISEKLSNLNHERFQKYSNRFTKKNSRQAILAFTGDVYQGMTLPDWSTEDFENAQRSIRILSGLYGVLRPLDLMQPYRLEMGTSLKNNRGKNLYDFWGTIITELLNKDLKKSGSNYVINLASNEYFSSVISRELDGTLIKPAFKDEKNGTYKIISFYAKKARGMMADYIVKNKLSKASDLMDFSTNGYTYDPKTSTDDTPVFLRSEAALKSS